jgi:hypothetical protein
MHSSQLILRIKYNVLAIIWLFKLRSAYPFPSICIPTLPTIHVKAVNICDCEICTDDNCLNNHTYFYTHYKLKSCHFCGWLAVNFNTVHLYSLTCLCETHSLTDHYIRETTRPHPYFEKKHNCVTYSPPPLPLNVKIYCILGESGQYTSEKSRRVTSLLPNDCE